MKRIIAVLAFTFLLSFMVSPLNATETRLVWTFEYEGFDVGIYAPYQAYPNDTMTIRVKVEVREEDVQDVTVLLKIYGSKSVGYLSWPYSLSALDNVDLSLGAVEDQYFNVSIPDDVDPGLIYSLITVSWKVWRESSWQERSRDGVFRVTYLRNKPYEDLQVAYTRLLANYSSLLSSYNQLQAEYNSLQINYSNLKNGYNYLQANYSILLTDYDELLANYTSLQLSFNSLQNDHNNLQINYDSLNSTYHSLLSDYSSLQASFNELKSKYEFAGEMLSLIHI